MKTLNVTIDTCCITHVGRKLASVGFSVLISLIEGIVLGCVAQSTTASRCVAVKATGSTREITNELTDWRSQS